jgi:hypothetical protein
VGTDVSFGDVWLICATMDMFAVTIFGLIIMVTLFAHELKFYLTTYTVHQVWLVVSFSSMSSMCNFTVILHISWLFCHSITAFNDISLVMGICM